MICRRTSSPSSHQVFFCIKNLTNKSGRLTSICLAQTSIPPPSSTAPSPPSQVLDKNACAAWRRATVSTRLGLHTRANEDEIQDCTAPASISGRGGWWTRRSTKSGEVKRIVGRRIGRICAVKQLRRHWFCVFRRGEWRGRFVLDLMWLGVLASLPISYFYGIREDRLDCFRGATIFSVDKIFCATCPVRAQI